MEVKFQKKIKKLFEKRSNLENELYKCHEIILEYIESQSRCSKIDTYIEKCRNYIEQAVGVCCSNTTTSSSSGFSIRAFLQ